MRHIIKHTSTLLILLSATACGNYGHHDELKVDGFEEYVSRFENAARLTGHTDFEIKDLIIYFDESIRDIGDDALCTHGYNKSPTIQVSPQFWNRVSDAKREILIFHELGHCLLNQNEHRSDFRDGHPTSILNKSNANFEGPSLEYYESHRIEYYLELFNY